MQSRPRARARGALAEGPAFASRCVTRRFFVIFVSSAVKFCHSHCHLMLLLWQQSGQIWNQAPALQTDLHGYFIIFFYDEDVQVVMYVASQKSRFYMAAVALLNVNILWNLQLDVKTWSLRWFQRFTDTSLNIEVPVVDMVNVIKFVGHGDASALLNDESFTHLVI